MININIVVRAYIRVKLDYIGRCREGEIYILNPTFPVNVIRQLFI